MKLGVSAQNHRNQPRRVRRPQAAKRDPLVAKTKGFFDSISRERFRSRLLPCMGQDLNLSASVIAGNALLAKEHNQNDGSNQRNK